MTRLLVITPKFHGYGAAIARSFERIGYDVATHVYDEVAAPLRKAWNKVRYELPSVLTGSDSLLSRGYVESRSLEAIRGWRPDIVLVIRGDVFGQEFWDEATERSRRVAVWLYDEVRRTPRFDPAVVSQYAAIATYSRLDVVALEKLGVPATYIPTGFDDRRPVAQMSPAHGLVNFVGAPLPGRVSALRALAAAGIPIRAWGRGWSDHPVDRARTWRVRSVGIPNARDVPGDQALAIMRDSAATLNVHGDQDGFTMRTFESAAVGGVQLIDRPDVVEFYEPGTEVLVFQGEDELVEQARRAVGHPADFVRLRKRARQRTLAEHTLVQRAKSVEQLWA